MLRNAQLADRIHPRHTLYDKLLNLPQLQNYFLRLVPIVRYLRSVP